MSSTFLCLRSKTYSMLEYYYITDEFQQSTVLSGLCLVSFYLIIVVLMTVNQWISYDTYSFKLVCVREREAERERGRAKKGTMWSEEDSFTGLHHWSQSDIETTDLYIVESKEICQESKHNHINPFWKAKDSENGVCGASPPKCVWLPHWHPSSIPRRLCFKEN